MYDTCIDTVRYIYISTNTIGCMYPSSFVRNAVDIGIVVATLYLCMNDNLVHS